MSDKWLVIRAKSKSIETNRNLNVKSFKNEVRTTCLWMIRFKFELSLCHQIVVVYHIQILSSLKQSWSWSDYESNWLLHNTSINLWGFLRSPSLHALKHIQSLFSRNSVPFHRFASYVHNILFMIEYHDSINREKEAEYFVGFDNETNSVRHEIARVSYEIQTGQNDVGLAIRYTTTHTAHDTKWCMKVNYLPRSDSEK